MARKQGDKFTAYVYEDDYKEMQKLVGKFPDIETGGDLFGLWQDDKTVVIQLFIGPGIGIQRTKTSFHQDVNYLHQVGSVITKEEGLCNVGEWHSHHQIGMPAPSREDKNTVLSNMPQLGLDRFVLFIASIEEDTSSRKMSKRSREKVVVVRCYMFREGLDHSQQGEIVLIPGSNPTQQHNKAQKKIRDGAEGAVGQEKKRKASDEGKSVKSKNGANENISPNSAAGRERQPVDPKPQRVTTASMTMTTHVNTSDGAEGAFGQEKKRNALEGAAGVTKNTICNTLDPIPCSHCKEPSVGRCVTCELFMCKKCIQSHNSYLGFRNHSVLTMEELSKPENKSKIKGRSHCKKHDQKKLKFYCKTCDEIICRRCMDFDHLRPDHECLSLETVAKEKLEALKTNYSTLESKLCEGNTALQELTNAEQSLKDDITKAKSKINQRKREILTRVERTLESNAKCLINEAEALYRNQHSTVVDKMAEVQTYVNKVKASADLSSSLIANGSDEEIVSAKKAVQENVEKVQNVYQRYVRTDTRILLYDDKQLDTKFVDDLVKKLQGTEVINEDVNRDHECLTQQQKSPNI